MRMGIKSAPKSSVGGMTIGKLTVLFGTIVVLMLINLYMLLQQSGEFSKLRELHNKPAKEDATLRSARASAPVTIAAAPEVAAALATDVPAQEAGRWGLRPGGGLLVCVREMAAIMDCGRQRRSNCTGVHYRRCLAGHGVSDTTYAHLVEARHGSFLVNLNDMYIGSSLLAYGEWSEDEVQLMGNFVQEESVIIDAGANIGAVTIPMAKKARKGLVIAYEPQRVVHQLLCSNVQLNSLSNVVVKRAGAGSAPSTLNVPNSDPLLLKNFGGLRANGGAGGHIKLFLTHDKVPVETIDSLGLARVDLVKVDAQGMEKEVIAGASQTIRRCRPFLYVEYENQKDTKLYDMIKELGYKCYFHGPPLYRRNNYNNNPDSSLFRNAVSFNIFCAPSEKVNRVPTGLLRGDLDTKSFSDFFSGK